MGTWLEYGRFNFCFNYDANVRFSTANNKLDNVEVRKMRNEGNNSNLIRCSKCKQLKLISEFSKNSSMPKGIAYWCKTCSKIDAKMRRQQNPERQKEIHKKYRKTHQEQRQKYREAHRQDMRQYYFDHINKHKEQSRIYYSNLDRWTKIMMSINARCNSSKHGYYKRGIKNYLTIKDLKFLWSRDKALFMTKPSIDRINTTGNYTKENCRFMELIKNLRRKKGPRSLQCV